MIKLHNILWKINYLKILPTTTKTGILETYKKNNINKQYNYLKKNNNRDYYFKKNNNSSSGLYRIKNSKEKRSLCRFHLNPKREI